MTLAQTAPKPATEPKIWEVATAEAQVNDIIRKPFCPIARVVGKEILKDGRTCLVVTFPGCHDRHIEEWVLEYPVLNTEKSKFIEAPATKPTHAAPATVAATPAPATLPAIKSAPSSTATLAFKTRESAAATVAVGPDDEPPHRGNNGQGRVQPLPVLNLNQTVKVQNRDNGQGRVQPLPAKKLMLSLVSVKRISSDIPAANFDPNELEIAGELSLAIGGFIIPPVLVRDSSGYKVISGHFQYHAAILARKLNPRAGETIPAIVLESENQTTASAMLKMLKFAA